MSRFSIASCCHVEFSRYPNRLWWICFGEIQFCHWMIWMYRNKRIFNNEGKEFSLCLWTSSSLFEGIYKRSISIYVESGEWLLGYCCFCCYTDIIEFISCVRACIHILPRNGKLYLS